MSWVRLDDGIVDHPKFVDVSDVAFAMWVRAIAYCNKHLTDGFVPAAALKKLTRHRAPRQVAQELVDARLFEVVDDTGPGSVRADVRADKDASEGSATLERGSSDMRARVERGSSTSFRVHDFLDHNPSSSKVRAEREAERLRKQKARENQGRDANGRITSGDRPPGRPGGIPPAVRAESGELSAGPTPPLTHPTHDPPSSDHGGRRGALERDVVEILRSELGERYDAIASPFDFALSLLQRARIDGDDAPDRRDVIREAAHDVGRSRQVDNVESLLRHKVEQYRDPMVLERVKAARSKSIAALQSSTQRTGTGSGIDLEHERAMRRKLVAANRERERREAEEAAK